MYMKPIKIQNFEKSLIKEAINQNPFITKETLAKKMGCSTRTIYRLLKTYKIVNRKPRLTMEQKCVKYLESIGYKFS